MGSESDHHLITMSTISLLILLLFPLAVSGIPVSLLSQAESLKSVLRLFDRYPTYPTYAQVLTGVGVRVNICLEDIEDTIDDAFDRDIDDAIEAGILRRV